MFTVEYFWEMRFDTYQDADNFAFSVGPIYDMYSQVIEVAA